MSAVLVLHGPNLNLLGTREPEIYGATTLDEVNASLASLAKEHQLSVECFQSNAEFELIEKIHNAKSCGIDAIIINPAAFTHTSVAIRDALIGVDIPFIECHLSNVHARESFRHHSYLSDIAIGVICGFGANSYSLALMAVAEYLNKN